MDAAFYENFNEMAILPYPPWQRALNSFAYLPGYFGIFLNGAILHVLIQNRSGHFRKPTYIFLFGLIMGNLAVSIECIVMSYNIIAGYWALGYQGCEFAYITVASGTTSGILFTALMMTEQASTIILRNKPWSNHQIGASVLFALVNIAVLLFSPFLAPDIISYPVMSDSRLYCFIDMTDSRPFVQYGGLFIILFTFISPVMVITVNIFLWLMISQAENACRMTVANSNSSSMMNAKSSLSEKKRIVLKRGIVMSVANAIGYFFFLAAEMYKLIEHKPVGTLLDGLSSVILSTHICIVIPILSVYFDVNVKRDLMSVFATSPTTEKPQFPKASSGMFKRARNIWSQSTIGSDI